MAKQLNTGGSNDSVTLSTRSLNQKLGTSPTPRTLSASEIGLLRQSKREIRITSVSVKSFSKANQSALDPAPLKSSAKKPK